MNYRCRVELGRNLIHGFGELGAWVGFSGAITRSLFILWPLSYSIVSPDLLPSSASLSSFYVVFLVRSVGDGVRVPPFVDMLSTVHVLPSFRGSSWFLNRPKFRLRRKLTVEYIFFPLIWSVSSALFNYYITFYLYFCPNFFLLIFILLINFVLFLCYF